MADRRERWAKLRYQIQVDMCLYINRQEKCRFKLCAPEGYISDYCRAVASAYSEAMLKQPLSESAFHSTYMSVWGDMYRDGWIFDFEAIDEEQDLVIDTANYDRIYVLR